MLRIREAREDHKPRLSQEALAYKAGVSVRTIQRAEDLGRANSETLRKIADALGISPGELFRGNGKRIRGVAS